MNLSWQWYVNQGFALIALVLVIISVQQKGTLKLLIFEWLATSSVFIGLCFLGNLSAIFMVGAGVVRDVVAIIFVLMPKIKHKSAYQVCCGILISILLVVLNIIFWTDWLNLLSILIGVLGVYTFFQKSSARIRGWLVVREILIVIYYGILLSPINVVIDAFSLVSAIVGIIRLDVRKQKLPMDYGAKND